MCKLHRPRRLWLLTRPTKIGFIRINTASAPLKPPGAAPTLTTIYNEADATIPSEFNSPSNSLSKDAAAPASTLASKAKVKPKRMQRLGLSGKAAPASAAVDGTESEKKRVQEIADSLDLGADLEPSPGVLGDGETRRGTGVGAEVGEPNRVVRKGDRRLESGGRRAVIGTSVHGGRRRCSVG